LSSLRAASIPKVLKLPSGERAEPLGDLLLNFTACSAICRFSSNLAQSCSTDGARDNAFEVWGRLSNPLLQACLNVVSLLEGQIVGDSHIKLSVVRSTAGSGSS
jgi:hypothetical protein